MRLLISGGCKNGKSTLAQRLCALQEGVRVYVATMRPADDEDRARVARHQAERGGFGFRTIERAETIEAILPLLPPRASVLLDSVTALLAWEMFGEAGVWDPQAGARVRAGLLRVAEAAENLIVVSDALYADGRVLDAQTEAYRRALSETDRALAARFDGVVEVVYGVPILHKGGEAVAKLVHQASVGAADGDRPVHGRTGVCPLG